LWQQDERRGKRARIYGDARPGKPCPKRPTSRGRHAAPGRPRPRGSSIGLGCKEVRASGSVWRAPWPGAGQPALAVPARQNCGGRRQDRNLPCDGQRLTAKSTAKSADRWVGADEDERWPAGPARRMLLGGSRLGRWPILARAPCEDGLNSEKDNPQEPRPGGRRANPPAPGRLGPWGSSAPRGTPTAFPSLARESLVLRPEGRVNLTAATAGGATHRPAVRRPDPSALLAGTPTRISRSNRVGPSGRSGI